VNTLSKEHCKLAKQPYISANKPYISADEPEPRSDVYRALHDPANLRVLTGPNPLQSPLIGWKELNVHIPFEKSLFENIAWLNISALYRYTFSHPALQRDESAGAWLNVVADKNEFT